MQTLIRDVVVDYIARSAFRTHSGVAGSRGAALMKNSAPRAATDRGSHRRIDPSIYDRIGCDERWTRVHVC